MAALDDESVFGAKPKPRLAHEIGQNIEDLSAPELEERIALLRSEIARLEKGIEARHGPKRQRWFAGAVKPQQGADENRATRGALIFR